MEIGRIRWRCRRGMLELDLLLQGFLQRGYRQLDDGEQQLFLELLNLSDQHLLDYLLNTRTPADPAWELLCDKIRQAQGPGQEQTLPAR